MYFPFAWWQNLEHSKSNHWKRKKTTGRIQGSKEVLSPYLCSLLHCQKSIHRPASSGRTGFFLWAGPWNRLPEDVMSNPWKYWMTGWIGRWATWSNARCPCLCQRAGTRCSLRSLPTQTIPWSYDCLLWNTTLSLTYSLSISPNFTGAINLPSKPYSCQHLRSKEIAWLEVS